jgi:cysteine-rich repeat protein
MNKTIVLLVFIFSLLAFSVSASVPTCADSVCLFENPFTGTCLAYYPIATPGVGCATDNNLCTNDICGPFYGICDHIPVTCFDGNPETIDTCDPAAGCVFVPDSTFLDSCDDGDACTINDILIGDYCYGTPLNCDDSNSLTIDYCDYSTGCVNTLATPTSCDDSNACTSNDMSLNGFCFGTQITCDDDDPLTIDTCDPTTGCVYSSPTECGVDFCDDSNPCTEDVCGADMTCAYNPLTGPACSGGTCFVGACSASGITCPDGNACTTDYFEGMALTCDLINNFPQGYPRQSIVCDDFNDATTDSCDPAIGCVFALLDVCVPSAEICGDGVDNDCSGMVDDLDFDGDGYLDPACGGADCNDENDAIYPEATEVPGNNLDEDCSGSINCYEDLDDDGYGSNVIDYNTYIALGGIGESSCSVSNSDQADDTNTDCDDARTVVHPGAAEVCGDGLDNDCDTQVDEGCAVPVDTDGDGTPDSTDTDDDNDGVLDVDDVADLDPRLCEDIDVDGCDDCSQNPTTSATPNVEPGWPSYTPLPSDDGTDTDGDGVCDLGDICTDTDRDGYCEEIDDCDDTRDDVNPGMSEICGNALDDDCDGTTDNADLDQDGYFDEGCGGTDCNDNNNNINPGATEVCNGFDDDCDGSVDEGGVCVVAPICGNGIVETGETCDDGDVDNNDGCSSVCALESGWVCVGTPSICSVECIPLPEVYDLVDNDCDGLVDELDPNPLEYYTKTELGSTWPNFGASLIGFSGTWVDSTVTDALEWLHTKIVDLQNQIDNIQLIPGPAGVDGLNGTDGAQGIQGEIGPTGPVGPAGADGLNRADKLLITDGNPANDFVFGFDEGVELSEPLTGVFELFLTESTPDASSLKDYYTTRGVPEPFLTYLKDAVDGNEPFALIKADGTIDVELLDAAKYNLVPQEVGMTVPGDYPEGFYTVEGDLNGGADGGRIILVLEVRHAPSIIGLGMGPKGDKGDTGAQGDQGIQGVPGVDGATGPKGDTGDAGPKGDTGETGAAGIHCWDLNIDGIPDIEEDINDDGFVDVFDCQGPKGDQGIQGIQGEKGDKGDKGDTGDVGPKGDTGDQGIQGIQGPKGDTGDQGVPGEKGDVGETGPKGDTGLQGEVGPQGIQGPPGLDGLNGTNGIDGKDGLNGTNGIDGKDGLNGIDGVQGPQGEIGPQGPQGEQGESGTADFTMNYHACSNLNSGSTKTCSMGKHMFCYLTGQKDSRLTASSQYNLCDINGNINGYWEVKAVRAWCEVRCIDG